MPGTDAHTPTTPAAPAECYAAPDADADADADPAAPAPAAPAPGPAPAAPEPAAGPAALSPRADCLHCGRPTEYPADRPGIVLCPVCEWQEAQRSACSG
ncbi:hypothetical protein ACWD6P_06000 [Streptomyces sp. NPDC002446]